MIFDYTFYHILHMWNMIKKSAVSIRSYNCVAQRLQIAAEQAVGRL